MPEAITSLSNTPVPTVLVLFGIFFLFFAIGGRFGAQIITDNVKKSLSASLGIILILSGVALYIAPQVLGKTPIVSDKPKDVPPQGFNLRSTSDELGQPMRSTMIILMKKNAMTINQGEKITRGFISIAYKRETVTEFLKKFHGRPIVIKEQVVSEATVTEFEINGKKTSTSEYGPLNGSTVLIELRDGKWVKNILGANPNPAQSDELNRSFVEEHLQYPEQPVQVGYAWELSGPQMAMYGGFANARSVEGHASLKFEEFKDYQGEQCAVVSERAEGKITLMINGNEAKMSLGGYGSHIRSLKSMVDLKIISSGEMKLESEVPSEEGTSSMVTIIGPYEATIERERI